MTKSHTLRIAAGAALALALALGGAVSASATPPLGESTCVPKGDKIDTSGGPKSVTVVAPAGYLISGYCVKAGSANQGLGPEEHAVTPSESVVITHSSGKDISHYVVRYTPKPPVITEPPVVVVPPVVVLPPAEPPVTVEPPVVVLPPISVGPPVVTPPVVAPPVATPAVPIQGQASFTG